MNILSAQEIMDIIPNRYPIFFIDAVDELIPGEKVVCRKNVTINEEVFQGHFPGEPVFPGVLIVEALAQTGCVLLLSKEENQGKIAYFAGINKVRFKRQVVPGDTLTLKVSLTKEKGGIYFAAIEAKVEDEIAVVGEIMCSVGD